MKRLTKAILVAAPALCLPVLAAAATDEEYQALEARLAQLEAARSTAPDAGATASRLKVNGFMSAGFGRVDIDDYNYDGLGEEWSHKTDSIVGVQLDGRVNAQTHAVVQLVGRGNEDFAVDAEWAYVGWRPDNNSELRAGRQRYPFFMLSEYIDVGFSYPWATPPSEVYLPGFPSSYDGLSWKYMHTSGSWTHDFQAYWGSSKFPAGGGSFELSDGMGIGLLSSKGNWQFSLLLSQAESTFSGNQLLDTLALTGQVEPLDGDVGKYGGIGVQYDDGRLLFMAEATTIIVDGFFPDNDQAYATVGYRFGKFLPHLTYSSSSITDQNERPDNPVIPALCAGVGLCLPDGWAGTPDGNPDPFPVDTVARALENAQYSVTLGVRYDFLPNADLKIDWTHVLDTRDTLGLFGREDGNVFYSALPGDDIDLFRVVVDIVF